MAIAVTTLTDLINSVGMLSDDECVSTFRAIVAASDAAEFDIDLVPEDNAFGDTILLAAITYRRVKLVQEVLASGPSLDATDKLSRRPLVIAGLYIREAAKRVAIFDILGNHAAESGGERWEIPALGRIYDGEAALDALGGPAAVMNLVDCAGHTALHYAAGSDNAAAMRALIEYAVVVGGGGGGTRQIINRKTTKTEATPIFVAALGGSFQCFELLMAAGGAWNDPDYRGLTVGSVAAERGDMPMLIALFEHISEDEIRSMMTASFEGMPLTHWSANNGSIETLKFLVGRGGDPAAMAFEEGDNALFLACDQGHLECAVFLVEEVGLDPSAATNTSHETPLIAAAASGNVELVEYLLGKGVDVSAHTTDGLTALAACIPANKASVVTALLAAGADPNRPDILGWSPVARAVNPGSPAALRVLLDDPRTDPLQRMDGLSLMGMACYSDRPEVIRMLYDAGVGVDKVHTNNEASALMLCASRDLVGNCRLLLELGADPNVVSATGWSALHYCAYYGASEATKLLVEAGADVEHQARQLLNRTALTIAVNGNNPATAEVLLEAGAKFDVEDGIGNLPLHYAAEAGFLRSCVALLRAGARVDANATAFLGAEAVDAGHTAVLALLVAHGDNMTRDGESPSDAVARARTAVTNNAATLDHVVLVSVLSSLMESGGTDAEAVIDSDTLQGSEWTLPPQIPVIRDGRLIGCCASDAAFVTSHWHGLPLLYFLFVMGDVGQAVVGLLLATDCDTEVAARVAEAYCNAFVVEETRRVLTTAVRAIGILADIHRQLGDLFFGIRPLEAHDDGALDCPIPIEMMLRIGAGIVENNVVAAGRLGVRLGERRSLSGNGTAAEAEATRDFFWQVAVRAADAVGQVADGTRPSVEERSRAVGANIPLLSWPGGQWKSTD